MSESPDFEQGAMMKVYLLTLYGTVIPTGIVCSLAEHHHLHWMHDVALITGLSIYWALRFTQVPYRH